MGEGAASMSPNVPLITWAPDADTTTPGVIPEVYNALPTARGYAPEMGLENSTVNVASLSSRCMGARMVRLGTNTPMLVLANATSLYSSFGTQYDLTRTSAYTAATSAAAWRFDSFGEVLLAVQASNILQQTPTPGSGTKFVDVTGAPAGNTLCVQSGFVMVGGTTTGGWNYSDGWWCSGLQRFDLWTPDIATQAAQGRLTQTPGAITRMISFKDNILAFKAGSILRGTYIGTPQIWGWSVVSTDIGMLGHDAVTQAEGILYFLGKDGFYRFNGGTPERINSAPWNYFRNSAGTILKHIYAQAVWDPVRRVVRWYYPGRAELNYLLTECISYHVDSDRWGFSTVSADWAATAPREYVSVPPSADSQYVDEAAIVIDSTTHAVKTYTAAPGFSSLSTGDFGDDDAVSMVRRARARWLKAPTVSTAAHYHRMNLSDALVLGTEEPLLDGKYDFSHSARWHRVMFNSSGMYEMNGFSVDVSPAGKR
jgi:hypothetical protein